VGDQVTRHTFRQNARNLLTSRAGEWVNALDIAKVAGQMAWRTRLSELRTIDGLVVENRCRKVGTVTVSEYRFVPPSQPVQAELFDARMAS
jgi:hypothetical protein